MTCLGSAQWPQLAGVGAPATRVCQQSAASASAVVPSDETERESHQGSDEPPAATSVTEAIGEGQQNEEREQPQRAAHLHGAHPVDVERLHLGDEVAPVTDLVCGDRWSPQVVASRGSQASRLVIEQLGVACTDDRCTRSFFGGGHQNRLAPCGRRRGKGASTRRPLSVQLGVTKLLSVANDVG